MNVSCKSEFDPPPLLERMVGLKMMGLKEEKRFIYKEHLITKSGGGFNSHSDLCSLTFHKSRVH